VTAAVEAYARHSHALYGRTLAAVLASSEETLDTEPVRHVVVSRCALVLQVDAARAVSAQGLANVTAVSDLRATHAVSWIREVRDPWAVRAPRRPRPAPAVEVAA